MPTEHRKGRNRPSYFQQEGDFSFSLGTTYSNFRQKKFNGYSNSFLRYIMRLILRALVQIHSPGISHENQLRSQEYFNFNSLGKCLFRYLDRVNFVQFITVKLPTTELCHASTHNFLDKFVRVKGECQERSKYS